MVFIRHASTGWIWYAYPRYKNRWNPRDYLRFTYNVPLDMCVHVVDRGDEESVKREFEKHVRSLGTSDREPFNLTGVRCEDCAVWGRGFPLLSLRESCWRICRNSNVAIPGKLRDVEERFYRRPFFEQEGTDRYLFKTETAEGCLRQCRVKTTQGFETDCLREHRYELTLRWFGCTGRQQFILDFFHALPLEIETVEFDCTNHLSIREWGIGMEVSSWCRSVRYVLPSRVEFWETVGPSHQRRLSSFAVQFGGSGRRSRPDE